MWNIIFCDRCKSYSPGESSVCYDKYSGRYGIISGYGSDFDTSKIYLTSNFKNEEELRERFPWITNMGEQFNNLCDECIRKMIHDKEARAECYDMFIAPFYTACCDKYLPELKEGDFSTYLQVEKSNKFPYLSRYVTVSWEDVYKYCMEDFEAESFLISEGKEFFNYYSYCTICRSCLEKYYEPEDCVPINDHPVLHSLSSLKSGMEILLDFHLRDGKVEITRHSCSISDFQEDFTGRFYMYSSRKNMLELKHKLRHYILKRNLDIIKQYFRIPKDIYNLITEN